MSKPFFLWKMLTCLSLSTLLLTGCAGDSQAQPVAPAELLRNSGFEQDLTDWTFPPNYAVDANVFRSGQKSLRLTNTDSAVYKFGGQSMPVKPGVRYRIGAWIKCENVVPTSGGRGASIAMEWSGPQGWINGDYSPGLLGTQDWTYVEMVTATIPAQATSLDFLLFLQKGATGTVWFDDATVTEYATSPWTTTLIEPNYRGFIPASQTSPKARVRVELTDQIKQTPAASAPQLLKRLRKGTQVLSQQAIALADVPEVVEVSLQGRAQGAYQVELELKVPNGGKSLALVSYPISYGGTAPQGVTFDRFNRTLVNGQPFFPLGLYFGPAPPKAQADYLPHLDRVAQSAFNTVLPYGINNARSPQEIETYLADLQGRNLKIIYSLKDFYPGITTYPDPVFGVSGADAIVENVVNRFKSSPALLGWYINDELRFQNIPKMVARNRQVQGLDPSHPTFSVVAQIDDISQFVDAPDVTGSDPYPIGDNPITQVTDWTRKTRQALGGTGNGGGKPMWQVLQAHDLDNYFGKANPGKYRAPTLTEMRCMTYQALINGANGLIYYSYFDLEEDRLGFDKRWADVRVVGAEVKTLFPALLSAQLPRQQDSAVRSDAALAAWSKRTDDTGNIYFLMTNTSPTQSARFLVTVDATAKRDLLVGTALTPHTGLDANKKAVVDLPALGSATLIVRRPAAAPPRNG